MTFDLFSWVIIPLLIFSARIVDVSLGTMRIIFVGKGFRKLAPLIGFFEVLIWLLAVREVMVNLRNIMCFFAYGAGFAAGNYVGMWIEEKLSIGMTLLRVVFRSDHSEFSEFLRQNDYGFTIVEGEGTRERVKILFSIIQRKNLPMVLSTLGRTNPQAFFTIENIKTAGKGVFPTVENNSFKFLSRKYRKSK